MDGSGKYITIKVKVNDGYDYDYDDGYISSITPSQTTVYLNIGESIQLNARIKPTDAYNKNLAWTSSNTNIASVYNVYTSGSYSYATIIGNNVGTTYVYVKAQDGSGEQEKIEVVVNTNSTGSSVVTSATANPSSISMNIADTQNVTITVYPVNATDKNITWVSDSTNVATVEKISNTNIRIIGVGIGSTNIRGIAVATGNEVCVIPVTVRQGTVIEPDYGKEDKVAPKIQLTGADTIKEREKVTLIATAVDDNLKSFVITENQISDLGTGLSISQINRISDNKYEIVLLGVEVGAIPVCINYGAAEDYAGNISADSNEVVIFVEANE